MNRQASIQMLGNPVVRKELKEARKCPPIIEPSDIHRIIKKRSGGNRHRNIWKWCHQLVSKAEIRLRSQAMTKGATTSRETDTKLGSWEALSSPSHSDRRQKKNSECKSGINLYLSTHLFSTFLCMCICVCACRHTHMHVDGESIFHTLWKQQSF